MRSNKLPPSLICAGGIIGLLASAPSGFTILLSILSGTSFALILLLGVPMLRDRGEGRLLAVGVVWFAVLGGGVHVYLLYLGLRIWWAYFIVLGFAGFCGMILSLVGASLVMMRWPDRIDSTLRVS